MESQELAPLKSFSFPLTLSRLTAEDSELLQISTVSLLIRLLIVRHIMQHLVPPVFANFEPK